MAEPPGASDAAGAAHAVGDRAAVPAAVRPAGTAGSVTVREYGTRYLRISVRYHGEGRFSWLRVPGPAHDRPQTSPSPEVAAALRRAADTAFGARLALGEWATGPGGERGGMVYRVPGAMSVARLLPSGDDTGYRLSVRALTDMGRTLRQLHDVPWNFSAPAPPHHGVRRLLTWIGGRDGASDSPGSDLREADPRGRGLRDPRSPDQGSRRPGPQGADALGADPAGSGSRDADPRDPASRERGRGRLGPPDRGPCDPGPGGQLWALARGRLGARLWERLGDWAEAARQPPGRGGVVLLHGAPSTGWLVPSPAGDHSVLLTGEEVTGGDPALDLGWILGELHELRSAATRGLGAAGQGPPVDYPAAARALLAGYLHTEESPEDLGPALPPGTARAATLRLAVHMRDFASFVGWHEDLRHYADLLAETLDADGEPTLHW
ncbi:hypothetical protein [Streptomyces sp. NPDC058653]|uniref:hypothetical protein n=1 Tax=Streptomyces sp. NPDC058653 TaxID=3346576 RepID=UPI0036620ED8